MDGSITRRGAPCWYKQTGVGLAAFNDSLILETCVYSLLRQYFRSEPYYLHLLENMLEVRSFDTEKRIFGFEWSSIRITLGIIGIFLDAFDPNTYLVPKINKSYLAFSGDKVYHIWTEFGHNVSQ